MAGNAVVSVQHLKKVYQSGTRRVEAIGDLTFDVEAGDFTCVVGPSGAGKTTLLKCLSGLLAPTSGAILVNGHAVVGPPAEMAVVFHEYGRRLFPWKTVRKNIELPLREKKIAKAERARLVDEALAAVALTGAGDSYPWQLSGGMQQRVAISRAVRSPPQGVGRCAPARPRRPDAPALERARSHRDFCDPLYRRGALPWSSRARAVFLSDAH